MIAIPGNAIMSREPFRPVRVYRGQLGDTMSNDNHPGSFHYSSQKARQGEIILRRSWQHGVFIAGLAGCVILLLVALLFTGPVR